MSIEDGLVERDLGGRPETPIDLEDFKKLCVLQCTREELAGFFGVSVKTIERRLAREEYRAAWDAGRATGKVSLRRRMWSTAGGQSHGAVQMQIHLSKHWLGMTDKQALDLNVAGTIEVSSARDRVNRKLDGLAERIKGGVAGIAASAGAQLAPAGAE